MNLQNGDLEEYSQGETKDNQSLTEASSQFNYQWHSTQPPADSPPIDQQALKKKGENKIKYRKLTQKLNTMGYQHQDKLITNKEITTPNKQRIMKNVIQFERQLKSQTKDYYLMELSLRQIHKVMEGKNQQNLHLLRNSKLIPLFFQLLQKIPSFHKNQVSQCVKVAEVGLKIMHVFSTMGANRDYLILTMRLKNLLSFSVWLINRDDGRCLYLCFKMMNILLLHRSQQQEQVKTILHTTVQLMIFSQLFKKIKPLLQQIYTEGYIVDSQLFLETLKFIYNILKSKTDQYNHLPVYSQQQKKGQSSLYHLIEYLVAFLSKYLLDLRDITDIKHKIDAEQQLACVQVNGCYLIVKIINKAFELAYSLCKKQIDLEKILAVILQLTVYSKKIYNHTQQLLLNQIIILIGYIALDSEDNQKKIIELAILDELCNLPIQFLMDSDLRDVIIPTICCMIHHNKTAINIFLKDNSPSTTIKYLRRQIQRKTDNTFTRKNSTKSLNSASIFYHQQPMTHRLKLVNRFPEEHWDDLISELQRYNEG